MNRRTLIASAFCAGLLPAQKADVSSIDLSLVDDLAIPNELFFVREHFPQPEGLSAAAWKLTIAGRTFSVDDITARPAKTLPVTLECAENPAAGGLVSHAEWTGVPLASLLTPSPKIQSVQLVSADGYSRQIPLAKALHPDTLLAFSMNGEKLPFNHGFPFRLIVPGWYGMDSVKWLRSIELLETPAANTNYLRQEKSLFGARSTDPVTAIQVKSVFTRPQEGAILAKRKFLLRGLAWAGENRIAKVEVSYDNGAHWLPARLDSPALPYAWTAWSLPWSIPKPGDHSLTVRATDDQGRQQPAQRPANRADSLEANHWQTIQIRAL